jgi:hypothetical protein
LSSELLVFWAATPKAKTSSSAKAAQVIRPGTSNRRMPLQGYLPGISRRSSLGRRNPEQDPVASSRAVFYLLLIVPHLLALTGLFAWAARVQPGGVSDMEVDGSDGGGGGGGGGGPEPPLDPAPVKPSDGLPVIGDAVAPARRLRVGERLADRHHPIPRRDHEPVPPRVPLADEASQT